MLDVLLLFFHSSYFLLLSKLHLLVEENALLICLLFRDLLLRCELSMVLLQVF